MSTARRSLQPSRPRRSWIITSGQLGLQDGKLVEGGVPAETAQCIANIKTLLAQHGAELTDVVKTLCFVRDLAEFGAFNEAYVAAFDGHRPAVRRWAPSISPSAPTSRSRPGPYKPA